MSGSPSGHAEGADADTAAIGGLRDTLEVLVPAPREDGDPLPEPWSSLIGPWDIPARDDRPYVYVNFIVSRDGRVTLNEPDNYSPAPFALGHDHDPWLMGLLRARADAVMIGDGTVKVDREHLWRPEFIFPRGADDYRRLRAKEGRAERIPLVIATQQGDIPADAVQLHDPDGLTILATCAAGAAAARSVAAGSGGRCEVVVAGAEIVDLPAVLRRLRREFGIERLLCEGGPRLYAALLADGLVDDEFLTLAPIVVGSDAVVGRPTLAEGRRFAVDDLPRSRLRAVIRSGDFLLIRSRYGARTPD